jgi:hypothetical protein
MVLDDENQRKFILELIKHASISGSLLDIAYEIKCAVERASLEARPNEGPKLVDGKR